MCGILMYENRVTMEYWILHTKEIIFSRNYLCKIFAAKVSESFVKSELCNASLQDDPRLDY